MRDARFLCDSQVSGFFSNLFYVFHSAYFSIYFKLFITLSPFSLYLSVLNKFVIKWFLWILHSQFHNFGIFVIFWRKINYQFVILNTFTIHLLLVNSRYSNRRCMLWNFYSLCVFICVLFDDFLLKVNTCSFVFELAHSVCSLSNTEMVIYVVAPWIVSCIKYYRCSWTICGRAPEAV